MARSYRELVVWQKAMDLAASAYAVADMLPASERFGLANQMRRSAVSIPSNIAEGHERRSRADYRRFIAIACGSLAEFETQLSLAQRLHGIGSDATAQAESLADETGRLLRAIERALRNTVAEEHAGYAVQPSALSSQPS